MTENKKPKLKLFDSSEVSEDFIRDLDTFLNLEDNARDKFLNFILNSKTPYEALEDIDEKQLSIEIGISHEKAADITKFFKFIFRQIALIDISLEDVINDITILNRDHQNFKLFFEKILGTHENFRKKTRLYIKSQILSNSIIRRVSSLDFTIDMRAIFDNDGKEDSEKLMSIIPVLIVNMGLEGSGRNEEVIFQLSMKKLEQFCENFLSQKSKLKEAHEKIYLKGES